MSSGCIFKVEILSIKLGHKMTVHIKGKFWHQLNGFENLFIIGGRKGVTEGHKGTAWNEDKCLKLGEFWK